jgi:hypothetical protein
MPAELLTAAGLPAYLLAGLPPIDPDDPLVPLRRVPREFGHLVPSNRSDRASIAVPTVFRYATRGLRGVRLEVVRTSGGLATSRSRIDRFNFRLSVSTGVDVAASSTAVCPDAARAEMALDAAGL